MVAMSFNEKLEKQFENFTIETPNVSNYIEHVYADFVELHALFLKEEVTIADISDKLQDVKDFNILETEQLDSEEEKLEEIASLEAERNDIIAERFYSIFEICKDRQSLYANDEYPFVVLDNQIRLKENLSDKQKMYILLLLCSNLNYFNTIKHELTVDFELLSYYTLTSYLPSKAIVKSFGKNSGYKGNAVSKIKTLAKEIGININENKISCISPQNVQERGCDLIAWIPFTDKIPNMLIVLSQCACGKNWDTKQSDTEFFKGYFYFEKSPLHIMFIPCAISNMGEKFFQHDRILDHIFFDRKRILEQFEEINFFARLKSFPAIEKSISDRILV
jgi:hypothetical protein